MTTVNELLDSVNKDLKYYEVVLVDKALGEDGKFIEGDNCGYGLRNKVTDILEHTSIMLPGVLWQATHFESTLKSMLAPEEGTRSLATVEDIMPSLN